MNIFYLNFLLPKIEISFKILQVLKKMYKFNVIKSF